MKGTRRADTLDISGVAETMGKNGNFIRVNSATIRVRAGERITRLVIVPRALPYRIDPFFLRRFSHHGRSTSVREFPLRLRIKNNSNAFGNFSRRAALASLTRFSLLVLFSSFTLFRVNAELSQTRRKRIMLLSRDIQLVFALLFYVGSYSNICARLDYVLRVKYTRNLVKKKKKKKQNCRECEIINTFAMNLMTGLWIFTRIRIFTDTIKEMEAKRKFLSLTDYYNDYSTLRRIF